MTGKTGRVGQSESADNNSMVCTAIDNDWGEARPNLLMHPPCACPRCAPEEVADEDDRSWLQLYGRTQRMRVEPVDLGETGRSHLG